jgi:hypothetical protein
MTRAADLAKLIAGGGTITVDDNSENLKLVTTDADASVGPTLRMDRQSASAADSDLLGKINFVGHNDAGTPEDIGYAGITAIISDASDGTEDGKLAINTMVAGTERSRIFVDASETVFNEDSVDVDFRVETNGNANALIVDGGHSTVGINTAAVSNRTLKIEGEGNTGAILSLNEETRGGLVEFSAGSGTELYIGSELGILGSGNNNELLIHTGVSALKIDRTGAVTKPAQPAFRAYTNANQYNFAVNTTHTLVFGAETFDQNGDFASNTFTAPVTGKYLLGFHLRLESPNQSQVYTDIRVVTTNRSAQYLVDQPAIGSSDYYTVTSMQLYDMDANDTAYITLYNSGGSAGMDITGFEQHGLFYGHLVC